MSDTNAATCALCGVVVGDQAKHDQFHELLSVSGEASPPVAEPVFDPRDGFPVREVR